VGKRILITGGAGFIGSHLADELLGAGHEVRVLDSLIPQVHGPDRRRPAYLDPSVELIVGDVRDPEMVRTALRNIDAVYHFAAMVGVGQSMYEVATYTGVNNVGTAVLLEALVQSPPERLVVASSMSLYGEGLYRTADGRLVPGYERPVDQLKAGDWELHDPDGEPWEPMPTPETKAPSLASVYALSKFDQERLCLLIGRAYGFPAVALRFFNVYGPRQALSNPYTGVLAIFASRLMNGRAPMVFEDGLQRRDFVSVYDVARAARLALETPASAPSIYNVGSGHSYSVNEIALRIADVLGRSDLTPEITRQYRVGDIRHCFADITLARTALGYAPAVDLDQGIEELAGWLEGQVAVDRVAEARAELASRGLTV
jgi:dTDP-L-rhamnose 4-epimerase